MSMTHDSLAVQAFKREHSRAPVRSVNHRRHDEAWIQKWKADHLVELCRNPVYASYFAKLTTRRKQRAATLRLKAVRKTGVSPRRAQ